MSGSGEHHAWVSITPPPRTTQAAVSSAWSEYVSVLLDAETQAFFAVPLNMPVGAFNMQHALDLSKLLRLVGESFAGK
jgi:hypothetical protein